MASTQTDSGKKQVPLMIDKNVHMTIKLYCVKTGITMNEFFAPYSKELENKLLQRVSEINEMERQAEIQRVKAQEDQRIAAENPLVVPGEQVEPITEVFEHPITN